MARTSVAAFLLLAGGSTLLTAGCAEVYILDPPDINLPPPEDLPDRLLAYRAGREKWHGDPRQVADRSLREELDLPWKAQPYRPAPYKVQRSDEWGDFVTRGYTYPSGHVMRYRVKIRPYDEIWYPVQVSRYKIHELPDEDPSIMEHYRGRR